MYIYIAGYMNIYIHRYMWSNWFLVQGLEFWFQAGSSWTSSSSWWCHPVSSTYAAWKARTSTTYHRRHGTHFACVLAAAVVCRPCPCFPSGGGCHWLVGTTTTRKMLSWSSLTTKRSTTSCASCTQCKRRTAGGWLAAGWKSSWGTLSDAHVK